VRTALPLRCSFIFSAWYFRHPVRLFRTGTQAHDFHSHKFAASSITDRYANRKRSYPGFLVLPVSFNATSPPPAPITASRAAMPMPTTRCFAVRAGRSPTRPSVPHAGSGIPSPAPRGSRPSPARVRGAAPGTRMEDRRRRERGEGRRRNSSRSTARWGKSGVSCRSA